VRVSISSEFDGGNIRVIDATNPSDIQLEIKKDNNSDFSQWFYFRAVGEAKRFRILNAGQTSYPKGWEGYSVVCSIDREDWLRVPTQYEEGVLRFDAPGDSMSVYYAYFAPYSYERHQDLVANAQISERVLLHTVGQSVDGREIDLIQVGDDTVDAKKIWVIARQHPGETMAEWWMEGFIDRLLDEDDAVARALLEQAVFYIVPNMNPDGSIRGNLRTNAAGANLNREWENPSPERSPEVYFVREWMDEIGVDLCLDVHGDEALPYNFMSGAEGIPNHNERLAKLQERLKQAYMLVNPDFQVAHGYGLNKPGQANMTICTNQIAQRFDCLAATIEQPFKDTADTPDPAYGWSPRRCLRLGASALDPIHSVIHSLR
jgi:murein tripeptide amidase MpaA